MDFWCFIRYRNLRCPLAGVSGLGQLGQARQIVHVFFSESARAGGKCLKNTDYSVPSTQRDCCDGSQPHFLANLPVCPIIFLGIVTAQRSARAHALAGDTGIDTQPCTEFRSSLATSS